MLRPKDVSMKKIDFGQDLAGVGGRMRQVRELNGLSQGRMARLVGIENQSTYGNYEAGRSVPLDFVLHYHNVCNEELGIRFSLDWLLKGVGQHPQRAQGPQTSFVPDGAEPNGRATAAVAQTQTQSSPAGAEEMDERISEHIARSTEVLRELLQRKYEGRGKPEETTVHSCLRDIPFAVMDMMSVVRYASPEACRLFKTTPEAVIGQSSMRFGKTAFQEVVPEQVEATLTKGYWMGEVNANTSQFEPLPVLMIMWLMRDEERNPCMGVVIVPKSDIDGILGELKNLKQETVKDHMAWEHQRVPDMTKPTLPE